MDLNALLRMEWFVRTYLRPPSGGAGPLSVLDVGSCDVNGCYRPLFPPEAFRYTGLDVAPGPNVDLVPAHAYRWPELADNAFDAVISGQALEHAEFFWKILEEMGRVIKPGGLLCVSLPWGYGFHRYPVDCYRFAADGMVALARYIGFCPLHASTNLAPPGAPEAWYSRTQSLSLLVARKPDDWAGLPCLDGYRCVPPDLAALATGFVGQPMTFRRRFLAPLAAPFRRLGRSLRKRLGLAVPGPCPSAGRKG